MGTTSEKLTYLNTTKSNIKDSIELMGTTILSEDTFRSYADKIKNQLKLYLKENSVETLWNNWNKVSGEGTSLTLNNTMEGKMKVDLKGNTYQYSTTGKNLIYTSSTTTVKNDNGANRNGYYCQINQTGTYYIYIYSANDNLSFGKSSNLNNASTLINSASANTLKTLFLTFNAGEYFVIWGANNPSINDKFMVALSPTATDYEPYTNGASPNPDYPQDIQVVSGDNTIKVEGKNLFDISTITENTYIEEHGNTGSSQVTNLSDYIEVKSNTSYTLSYDYSTLLNLNQRNFVYYDNNKNFVDSITYLPTNKVNTITTPNNAKYLRFSYDKNYYSIMLNEGNTALPYQPYQSQSYPISLGNIELCKIGTYQDSIVKDNGKWYLNKQIGKVVLDENSNCTTYTYSNMLGVNFISALSTNYTRASGICNYSNKVGQWSSNSIWVGVGDKNIYWLNILNLLSISTIADFKTWLSTNNVIIYYVLATPTYEEITDTTLLSQLEALAYSYDGTTNISQVNDDLASILNVTALEDI